MDRKDFLSHLANDRAPSTANANEHPSVNVAHAEQEVAQRTFEQIQGYEKSDVTKVKTDCD